VGVLNPLLILFTKNDNVPGKKLKYIKLPSLLGRNWKYMLPTFN